MSYTVTIDDIERQEWEKLAGYFTDYSIYQTWAYQQVRGEMSNQDVSRFVVKDENGEAVAMGQVRIKHVKPIGLRIGYVQRGPLVRGINGSLRCSAEALNAVCEAYLGERVNVLRIVPNLCDDEMGREFASLLKESGFYRVRNIRPYHSMFLSLGCSEDNLRKGLHQSWRRQLHKAEKAELEVVECDDEESFEVLGKLYLETIKRKDFRGLDPHEFIGAQRILGTSEKMKVIMVYHEGEPVTAHLSSNLGDSAIFLLSGSSEKGLALRASYLAWWKAITLSNQIGVKRYDVGGIDFEKNPTVSRFKAGIGGDDIFYIGGFEACKRPTIKALWQPTERIYNIVRGR